MNPRSASAASNDASRRRFLQTSGLGLAAAWMGVPQSASAAPKKEPKKEESAVDIPPHPARLKLGLASYTLRKFDLDKTLAMTHRAGLEYICLKDMHLPLTSTPEEIAAAVAKVKAAGLKLYGCGVVSMRKPEDVERAFAYAKAAGMQRIVAMPVPEVLPLLNQKVQEFDIQIAIHNHGPGDKVWPTPESAYEKIKDLDRRIGLCMDIGHTVRIGNNLVASTRTIADRLHDVHMKDVTAATDKGQCCQLGRGVIDIPAFIRTLIELKYAGVVSFEYEADGDDPLPGLCESVGYARGVMAVC